MKRILIAVTMLVLVLPAMRQAEARTDVSIDFFYDNIGSDGSWVEMADYGYCWQPSVAVSNSSWRPYSDGYWAYTDVGWTWVSYEDFGWATYHYGRWTRLRDRGWFWVPGREWGPAWVSWRTGGDYVGWAPLPPRGGGEMDYDNRPINGQVDVEFDIGPAYYNFVDVRYIGEPVLRERIFEANLNVTYISQTVNVTNITYTNSTVYNYGPDYNTLSRYSTRPIRRMTLERDANVDLSVAVKSNSLTRVQGDKLVVAAPLTLQKPPKPIAPKVVKEKIAKPTFEHGWSGVSDPKAQAELKQKMKSEDPKNIPPPSIKPRENAETAQSPASASPAPSAPGTTPATVASPAVSANPAATAAPTTSASPALTPDKGKGKDKRLEKASPLPTAAASVSPSSSPPVYLPRVAPPRAPARSPSLSTVPGTSPAPTRSKSSEVKDSHDRQQISPPITTSPDGTPFKEPPMRDKAVKEGKRTDKAPDITPAATPRQPSDALTDKVPRKPTDEPREMTPAPPNREAPPDAPRKHPLPPERVAPPPGPAANGPVTTEAPRSKRGPDKKTTEPSPSPGS
ncbi:MAG TPA: DUF6600 domain-containing protein [Chthoniobacterales bacterium]